MKKMMMVALVATLVLLVSSTSFALNSPVVSRSHGVFTGMFVGTELSLGFEYGLTSEFAVIGNLGHFSRFGAKYELRPTLAVIGAMDRDGYPYMGLNGSRALNGDLLGMGEFGVTVTGNNITPIFELGVRHRLDRSLDIRGGLISEDLDFPRLQIGIGYGF